MDTKPLCPNCGRPLEAGAPKGLCPECLMKGAFPTGTDTGGESTRFVPPKVEELAEKLPQLEILEFIGQGGMGAVYKARQKQLDRIVALKILPPQAAGGPGFAERFTREARALAKLNHPHIVTLYEFGQADGLFYFLMEFVDGIHLRQLLAAGRLAPKEALAIVPQICEALQYAHERGIVHRDIKPENVLLSKEGQLKIADFGVAKLVASAFNETTAEHQTPATADLTEAGSRLGTPHYMAPEQIINAAEVDHRADIYSLGVVFYQMLTGELPSGRIEPPSRKVVIDVRLDEVVMRALEKEPERRYQQVSEVKTQVETIAATPPPGETEREETGTGKAEARKPVNLSPNEKPGLTTALLRWLEKLSPGIAGRLRSVNLLLVLGLTGILGGGAVVICYWAESHWSPFKSGTSAPSPMAARPIRHPPFTARLHRGEVELVAVGRQPWSNHACWLPNGVASSKPFPGAHMQLNAWTAGMETKKIAFRIHNESPDSISIPVCRIKIGTNVTTGGSSGFQPPDSRSSDAFFYQLVACPTNAKTMDVSLGVANGPWQTQVVVQHSNNAFSGTSTEGGWNAAYNAASGHHGEVAVDCTYSRSRDSETRMVYEDGEGRLIPIRENSTRTNPNMASGILLISSNEFARIKEFRLQRRKYQWVEFLDVSLDKGHSTVVKVKDAGAETEPQSSEAPNPAFSSRNQPAAVTSRPLSAGTLQFRLVLPEDSTVPADWLPSASGRNRWYHLSRQVLLDETDIARTGIAFGPDGRRLIEIRFTDMGARRFKEVTSTNVGRQLAIVYRGQVLSAPVIQSVLPGGECQVTASMGADQIYEIVDSLNRTAASPSDTWRFSRAEEKILPFKERPEPIFGWLDLDSGTVLTNSTLNWESRSGTGWIRARGLDVVTTESAKHLPVLLGFNMIIAPAPTNGWEIVTAADVVNDWNLLQEEPRQEQIFGAVPGQSDTFFFQTREGGKGILQILGFAENARGVKIRYKLLQHQQQ